MSTMLEAPAHAGVPITAARSRELPRVDLLPPVYAEQEKLRRTKALLAAAVVAAVLGTGGAYVVEERSTAKAREELATVQAEQSRLRSEQAKYTEVPLVNGQVDAARGDVILAMGDEVRWSQVLADLSARVPSGVWLSDVTFAQVTAVTASGVTAPAAPTGAAGSIATINVTGNALTQAAVASWLESLSKQPGFTAPTFTSAIRADVDGTPTVTFESTVQVTSEALSHRYDEAER